MVVDFKDRVSAVDPRLTFFDTLKTLQVNLGNVCNQSCQHCHVAAGPAGKQIMRRGVMEEIVDFLGRTPGITLDVTGGCPELNPDFKYLVEAVRGLTPRLMVRTNLTVLMDEDNDWIPRWYRDNRVVIIASLPCYTRETVDLQRGKGVYDKSISALKLLNALGYGDSLELDLVYNPGGDFLPGPQKELESDYKRALDNNHGVRFNSLFTITNIPIGRFRDYLAERNALEKYLQLLDDSFNPGVVGKMMCRSLVSIDWQGTLYNCDFNQALRLPIRDGFGQSFGIERLAEITTQPREIIMGEHCYACTAGAGSCCTGSLS